MVLKARICGSGGAPEGPGRPWADGGDISDKSGKKHLLIIHKRHVKSKGGFKVSLMVKIL